MHFLFHLSFFSFSVHFLHFFPFPFLDIEAIDSLTSFNQFMYYNMLVRERNTCHCRKFLVPMQNVYYPLYRTFEYFQQQQNQHIFCPFLFLFRASFAVSVYLKLNIDFGFRLWFVLHVNEFHSHAEKCIFSDTRCICLRVSAATFGIYLCWKKEMFIRVRRRCPTLCLQMASDVRDGEHMQQKTVLIEMKMG